MGSFEVGDVTSTLSTALVFFVITKKNVVSTEKTRLKSVNLYPFKGSVSLAPSSLQCPQENTLIYGTDADKSVLNETFVEEWDQCAQRCAEYTADTGHNSCTSWTFNSNRYLVLGLGGGICRLLASTSVSSLSVTGGVQSGHNNCHA